MVLGPLAWLVPVVGPAVAAALVAAVLGGDRRPVALGYAGGYAVGAVVVTLAALAGVVASVVTPTAALVVAVTMTVTGSLAVVHRIDRPAGRWGQRLRSRLVMGVPWGTLVSVAGVLAVYLFVQGGATAWRDPVTLPFRAWSVVYPQGLLAAPFAHDSASHLVGNLLATLVFGSLAEFAWGHFPRERGASSFGSASTNPLVRAFVVFPAVVVGVGLLTSVFSLGPVIGFSGVVFAFAGFALTRYPLGTVVAAVGVGAVRLAYFALRQPVVVDRARPSPPAPPSWAEVAIQAHALGLLLGVVLGWYVFARREETASALAVWTGVLLLAVEQQLWAVYWFRGGDVYVLYRGVGVVLVALLAVLVTAALRAGDRPLRALLRQGDRGDDATATDGVDGRAVEADGGRSDGSDRDGTASGPEPAPEPGAAAARAGDGQGGGRLTDAGGDLRLTGRSVAVLLLVLGVALLAGPGVGSKLFTVDAGAAPGNESQQVVVGDYTVTYAEDVPDQRVAVVDVELFGEMTAVNTSGVIVSSAERSIWQPVVSEGRLAFDGRVGVSVGGVGWRETVVAERRGWTADGGDTAYVVYLEHGDQRRLVHRSDPATAEDTIAGRNVTVTPGEDGFFLVVENGTGTVDTAPVPGANESVEVGGLTLSNEENTIVASVDDTRVRVVQREEYE